MLHYVRGWLPLSEQFVHAQITRSRHRGAVVAKQQIDPTGEFADHPVRSLHRPLAVASRLGLNERRALTVTLSSLAMWHRASLIHVHFGYRLADVAGTSRRLRLPVIVSLHGHDVTAMPSLRQTYENMLPEAAAVIVPSVFLASQVVSAGARPEAVHVIPSGVDTGRFRPTPLPEEPNVLFVGRFVEKKGLDVLLAAWPLVRAAVPGARLHLLGYGPLEHLARVAGAGVELTTGGHAAVQESMRRARVVVTPSRTAADGDAESLLLVNLEAQACGRPVVTTRHGGIPEYVRDGETALVVPEADADAVAHAIIRLLREGGLAERMAAKGPQWASRFDTARCARQVDELYDAVLRARSTRAG